MENLTDSQCKKVIKKLLKVSLTNAEPVEELISEMFDDDEMKNMVSTLCNSYMTPKYMDSTLVTRSIDVRAVNALLSICKRDNLGIIPLDFNGEEKEIYEEGDKINILFLSKQKELIDKAILEAISVSGTADAIKRKYVNFIKDNLKINNPMFEISGVNEDTYKAMLATIKKLPYPLKFTLFPEKEASGKLNIGFLTSTEPVVMMKEKRIEKEGPYYIPKIISVVLAAALLRNPVLEAEYEKMKKEDEIRLKNIEDLYFSSDVPYYLVPAITNKNDYINIFMDKAVFVDFNNKDIDYEEINKIVEQMSNGLNHTVVPMTEKEYQIYKNEVMISSKDVLFYENNRPKEYIEPEKMQETQISERLIDMLNRKREQLLLMSDDMNGRNLMNLDNYIAGTVMEMIMREDEDYTDYIENEEILDNKEAALIAKLESLYTIRSAFEEHDKVSELINAERSNLQSFISNAEVSKEEERDL